MQLKIFSQLGFSSILIFFVGLGFWLNQYTQIIAHQNINNRLLTPSGRCDQAQSVIQVSTTAELSNALGNAQPGHVIKLADGDYVGSTNSNFIINVSGEVNRPIMLCGSRNARLVGKQGTTSGNPVLQINANYWVFEGFTVTNGKKGIRLSNASNNILDKLYVHTIGDEGIRFQSGSSRNVLQNSLLENIGTNVASDSNNGNGEGVYIGTAMNNPESDPADASDYNQILNNTIGPNVRSEAIDIKEGSANGLVQGNQFDGHGTSLENSAGSWMDIKGDSYIIRGNTGAFALDPDGKVGGGYEVHYKGNYGKNNVFIQNHADLSVAGSNASYGFFIEDITVSDLRGNIVCDNNTVAGKPLSNVNMQMYSACNDAATATPTPIATMSPTLTPTLEATSQPTATSTPPMTTTPLPTTPTPTHTPTPTLFPRPSSTPFSTPIPNAPSVYLVLIANQN